MRRRAVVPSAHHTFVKSDGIVEHVEHELNSLLGEDAEERVTRGVRGRLSISGRVSSSGAPSPPPAARRGIGGLGDLPRKNLRIPQIPPAPDSSVSWKHSSFVY